MKKAIDLEGNEVSVINTMTVNTIDGVHYLLTAAEEVAQASKEEVYELEKVDYISNHKYKDDRKKLYGTIEEQLDMKYWDEVNGTSKWKDHIDTIKLANPKPTI